MMNRRFFLATLISGVFLAGCGGGANRSATSGGATTSREPISIAYSDWPGYVVWDICEQQGFFKKNGANVKLVWFPVYTDSLNALAAGQVDANSQTWPDAMSPISKGVALKAVQMFDNSWGNDAMIARSGINSVKDLRGKKVATELGTCDHFLMLKALESAGMTEKDVQFIPIAVQDCPAAMLSGRVDAAVVWEPSRSKILKAMQGSKIVFSSADLPGIIPDLLMMKSSVVAERPEDVQKIVDSWYQAIDWWKANPDKAIAILAKRTDTNPKEYAGFVKGTRILSSTEAAAAMTKSPRPTSLFANAESTSKFLMGAKQIDKLPDYAAAIEPKFTKAAVAKGLGKMPPYTYSIPWPSPLAGG